MLPLDRSYVATTSRVDKDEVYFYKVCYDEQTYEPDHLDRPDLTRLLPHPG